MVDSTGGPFPFCISRLNLDFSKVIKSSVCQNIMGTVYRKLCRLLSFERSKGESVSSLAWLEPTAKCPNLHRSEKM